MILRQGGPSPHSKASVWAIGGLKWEDDLSVAESAREVLPCCERDCEMGLDIAGSESERRMQTTKDERGYHRLDDVPAAGDTLTSEEEHDRAGPNHLRAD